MMVLLYGGMELMGYKVGGIYTIKEETYVFFEQWNNTYYLLRLGKPIYQHNQVIKYLGKDRRCYWRVVTDNNFLLQDTDIAYLGIVPENIFYDYCKKLVKQGWYHGKLSHLSSFAVK